MWSTGLGGFLLVASFTAGQGGQVVAKPEPSAPGSASMPVVHQLGVVKFSVQLPSTWKPTDIRKAKALLEKDGVQETPVFAFEGSGGGLAYGTWKVLPAGVVFTAETIAAMDDPAMAKWGIKPADIRSFADGQARGLRFAYLRARGLGNGQEFSPKQKVQTVGIWVDIPVTFKDEAGYHSGLASLFYRSSAAEATAGGEAMFHDIIDALEPGASVVPASEYRPTATPKETQKEAATPEKRELSTWPENLASGAAAVVRWPTDRQSYEAGLREVDRLIALFPASPWLVDRRADWMSSRRERAQTAEWLSGEDAETRRRELTSFHELALAEIEERKSPAELRGYLAYVTLVWPDNPFVRPPSKAGSSDMWKHWQTGQVLHRSQVPGRIFWHTLQPVCRLAGFTETAMPEGFRLPRQDEYEVLWKQGTIARDVRYAWLVAGAAEPAPAVPMEFDKDRLGKLKNRELPRQCYAVLNEK